MTEIQAVFVLEVVELGEDNMKHRHIIRSVEDGSIAWELGVEPGD